MMLLCLLFSVVAASSLDAPPWTIVADAGYPVENHEIATRDFYLLNVQRIPRPGAPVVYLQHGLLDSSATWVMNSPSESLAFILYDQGFDVWFGNQRGNRYSNTMSNGADFDWYFSMDQMAEYDDEALLTYITNATGKPTLGWVGHSRGTQQMFYGLSRFPQHAQYINSFIALAPVAWVGHMKSLLLQGLAHIDTDDIFDKVGYHDFLPSGLDVEDFCHLPFCGFCKDVCDDFIGSIMGPGVGNATQFNQSKMEFYLHHFPAGTSSQEMAHYAQLYVNDNLALYNYGESGNEKHYGQKTPPVYDLTQIPDSVPIALFTGGDDYLADPTDVLRLISTLGRDRFESIVDIPFFNHASFIWSLEAAELVYKPAIAILKKYSTA